MSAPVVSDLNRTRRSNFVLYCSRRVSRDCFTKRWQKEGSIQSYELSVWRKICPWQLILFHERQGQFQSVQLSQPMCCERQWSCYVQNVQMYNPAPTKIRIISFWRYYYHYEVKPKRARYLYVHEQDYYEIIVLSCVGDASHSTFASTVTGFLATNSDN